MGQCLGKTQAQWNGFSFSDILPAARRFSGRSRGFEATQLVEDGVLDEEDPRSRRRPCLPRNEGKNPPGNPKDSSTKNKSSRRLQGIFSLPRRKYVRQTDDSSIGVELFDLTSLNSPHPAPKRGPASRRHAPPSEGRDPPSVLQIAGLRNAFTCSGTRMQNYQQFCSSSPPSRPCSDRLLPLDPRRLHQSVRSVNSTDGGRTTPNGSIDLEWENDALPLGPASTPPTDPFVDDTPSVTATAASRASSQNSIPGLDWDSQTDNDLISLGGPSTGLESLALDLETEQLITEIELLTNRALQETCQWTNASDAHNGNNWNNVATG